jgi:mxaK protein
MRRRTAHALFASVAAACALAAAWQGWRLQRAVQLNRDVAAAAAAPGDAPAPHDAPREVKLARATVLAQRAGAQDAAFRVYGALVQQGADDAVARQALYNLGNLHLRQGIAGDAMPMIELAKQRYRDLLRVDPDDWDARVNLERALRLAPEEPGAALADEDNEPVERRRIRLRGMDAGDLP